MMNHAGGFAGLRRREALSVAAVLLVGLLVRAIYLEQYRARVPYYSIPIADAASYDRWAQRVAGGEGYGPSPFYWSPLYPYFLALAYSVLGRSFTIVYVIQAIIGLGNLLLVYTLGRRLFGHAAGLAAMILLLAYAPVLFMETKLLSETLALALNSCALLLIMQCLDRPRPVAFLAAGLALGLSTICRSGNLLFVVLLLVRLGVERVRRGERIMPLRLPGLLLLGVAVPILPVTARNYFVGHDLVLIQTNGGMTFAQGNNENALGVLAEPPGISGGIASQQAEETAVASRALGRPLKPSEASRYWFRQGLGFIRAHPGDYIVLLLRKLLYSVNNREEQDNYELYYEAAQVPLLRLLVLPFSVLTGLAVFGFIRSRGQPGRRAADALALYPLSVLLTLLIFYASSRYRLPAVPALAVFAGFGLVQLVEAARRRNAAGLAMGIALPACLTIVGSVPHPLSGGTGSFVLFNVGMAYVADGDLDRGIPLLEDAAARNPDDGATQFNLGYALLRRGDTARGIEHLERAATIPNVAAQANCAIGQWRMQQQDLAGAERRFRKAIAADPAFGPAHQDLGRLLFMRGDFAGAVAQYREAVRLMPDSAEARFGLGVVLMSQGDPAGAVRELSEAQQLAPDSEKIIHALNDARGRLHRQEGR
ncbi:MAG: tetratricopeptide repeat protein [Phycisphaerae bacterium]